MLLQLTIDSYASLSVLLSDIHAAWSSQKRVFGVAQSTASCMLLLGGVANGGDAGEANTTHAVFFTLSAAGKLPSLRAQRPLL